jgi:hypothetical protein
MRATVGSLPPAVYWRRRAVVLGGVLLVIILWFVACSGGNDDKDQRRGLGKNASAPAAPPSDPGPSGTPSFADAAPGGGPSLPAPGDLTSQQPSLGDGSADGSTGGSTTGSSSGTDGSGPGGTDANVNSPAGANCADSEISVVPVPSATTVRRGNAVTVKLTIKNISTRTCSRDVGADPQELYIDQAARKYWSSDTCTNMHGSNVLQFSPGTIRQYTVTWNGRQSSKCQGTAAAGPTPIPGQYELRGRVGTKISNPVTLTIVA